MTTQRSAEPRADAGTRDVRPQLELFTTRAPAAIAELPDSESRRRIAEDLDTSLLVEAGAGAGKTTEMVTRMVALVRSGRARVEDVAAVTFTRKAAAELRERFQTELERALRDAHLAGAADAERLDRALRDIDRAFIGTIHSFCGRLLRERPLDAGLDPGFRETLGAEQVRLTREYWTAHIERLAAEGDPSLAALDAIGLQARQLFQLFGTLTQYPDVAFPAEAVSRPDPSAARAELETLLDETLPLMPRREPDEGWDDLQSKVRMLQFHRRLGWDQDVRFLAVLSQAFSANMKSPDRREKRLVNRKRWEDGATAAALGRRFEVFAAASGTGGHLLTLWYAHRYPVAIAFARAAAESFRAERQRAGTLFFEDLLQLSAALLRNSPAARDELAGRYRHLLVDEFQDTDPLQAEVLFLLAADPAAAPGAADWRTAVPRPGSLFVVGDPKQSIYRFRRADISLYTLVKRRFRSFGAVLELTSNFRSGPPIERFVNEVFERRFGLEETERQAPFAPMRARRPYRPGHDVLWYTLVKTAPYPRDADLAGQDAERVASWIAREVASGTRAPGDFMVLTRRKKFLEVYAQAVEARNLPVQVTGAGIGIELELRELRLLLEALADPGDARLTVAALGGLFFGLDFEQLAAYVLDHDGRFTFVTPPPSTDSPVEQALATLHDFWRLARREPADVVVSRIVDRLGLLPFAAAGDLADSRAGALLYVLEAVRTAALNGEASLKGALDAIDAALETDEAEAPLVPAREDVVRIMNVHQAKGLEAPVVILAEPFGAWDHVPARHIERAPDGSATGYVAITERTGNYTDTTLARPLGWEEHDAAERAFEDAEADRMLYVAATRSRDLLLIGSYHEDKHSPWSAFFPYTLMHWPRLDIAIDAPPERDRLDLSAEQLEGDVARADAARVERARPTYRAAAVTTRVRSQIPFHTEGFHTEASEASEGETNLADPRPSRTEGSPADARPAARGQEWGTVVHRALEAAGRGVSGAVLRDVGRGLLIAADRPLDAAGEPLELDELVALAETVVASAMWQRARVAGADGQLLVETPFALVLTAEEYAAIAPASDPGGAPLEVVEGVIDLAFRDANGWTIVDYKSDADGAHVDAERRARYRAQVDLYAAAWTRLTGEPVAERAILFTADGHVDSW